MAAKYFVSAYTLKMNGPEGHSRNARHQGTRKGVIYENGRFSKQLHSTHDRL